MTTRDRVLAILGRAEERYISGENISAALGISRAAVNGAVKALRAEGYEILSATNRGYLLQRAPDRLTPGDLLRFLPLHRVENILCLEQVDSTNKLLQEMAYDGAPHGQVVVAGEQTRGRGRRGRSFFSPKDQGLYLSVLLRPQGRPADTVALTAWTAVAVSGAVERVCGVRPGIKWVNDLVLGGRKLCGILTEMLVESESGSIGHLIVGVGLNVGQGAEDFPPELREIATSLYAETGVRYSRAQLAAEIVRELDALWSRWPGAAGDYLAAYRRDSTVVGREVWVSSSSGRYPAKAVAIGEDFSLVVQHPDGRTEALSSGEVSVGVS